MKVYYGNCVRCTKRGATLIEQAAIPCRHPKCGGTVKIDSVRTIEDSKENPMKKFKVTVTTMEEGDEFPTKQTYSDYYESATAATEDAQEQFGLGAKIEVEQVETPA